MTIAGRESTRDLNLCQVLEMRSVLGLLMLSPLIWREGGLRVIPGHYLARDGADGINPGNGYIRVALVHDKETTAEALHRLVAVLG